jgi:hypothetical protein
MDQSFDGYTTGGESMGLLDGLLGNAAKIDAATIQQEFGKILTPGESVEHAYQLIRDYFVFTNKRLVLVDKQGMTGSKVEYHSIPYKSITHFSIESAGTLDLDAELKIWVSSKSEPIQKQFNKKLSIYEVHAVLAGYVLK